MIPNGWQTEKLGSLADFINGRGFKPNEWSVSGLPIIRIQNLNGSDSFNYFDGDYNPKIEINKGDLLFAWSGSRGTSFGPHFWHGGKAVLNYHTWKVVPCVERVNQRFLYEALKLLTVRIEEEAHGAAALVHTQKNRIVEYEILLPSVLEQEKIAEVLQTWKDAISILDQLIEQKKLFKRGLFQCLLEGQVRFKGFENSSTRRTTPIGSQPKDWQEFKFGEIVTRVRRKNTIDEKQVLTASGEHGLVDQREFFNRSVAGKDLSKYYLLKKGEFAYNRSAMKGYPFGAIKRLDRYDQGVLSTLYFCFELVDTKRCDSNYLRQFFEAHLLDRQLRRITQVGGRAHGLLNINNKDFYNMTIVLPSLEEQKRIAEVLNTQDREIELLIKKLGLLKEQKKGLMQQLLTGNVRVGEAVCP